MEAAWVSLSDIQVSVSDAEKKRTYMLTLSYSSKINGYLYRGVNALEKKP
jgi:hypothetical protein